MNLGTVTSTVATYTSHVPADWAIIAALIVIVGALSLKPGSMHAMAALFALPFAFLLNMLLPGAFFVGPLVAGITMPFAHTALFVVAFVISFLFVTRITSSFSTLGGILEATLSGVSVTVLLLVVWQMVPALTDVWHFGPAISAAFAEAYRFWWIILSLLVLAFARS